MKTLTQSILRASGLGCASLVLCAATAWVQAQAQTQPQVPPSAQDLELAWPTKPLRFVVPYPPGGPLDTMARLLAEKARPMLGQAIIVENRPGAGGNIGADQVARAKPDGYTLFLGQTGEITVNRVLMKDLGYDPMKDLVPVVMIGNAPLVLLVPADAPYNSLSDLIARIRAQPGAFSYGTVGAGTPGHLAAVALGLGANLDMVNVPYKGVGPLISDLMGARLQMFFSSASAAMPQIRGGKLKPLAVTTTTRMHALPDVPTVAEIAVPGFSYTLWGGLFVPLGTSSAIIDSINREVNAIMATPDIRARFETDDQAVAANTPAQFAAYVRAEAVKYEKLITDAKLKYE